MEENFATRLKLFIESINVPTTQFADICDIPRPSFSQLLSGRNQKVSDILITKIHRAYPNLSVMWLMFGEGPMLRTEERKENERMTDAIDTMPNDRKIKESSTEGQPASVYPNLNSLNQPQNSPNTNIYQQLEENKKIVELQLQIEKLQKNPRRVAQITVFYDDTTFETFVPLK